MGEDCIKTGAATFAVGGCSGADSVGGGGVGAGTGVEVGVGVNVGVGVRVGVTARGDMATYCIPCACGVGTTPKLFGAA